MGSSDCIRPAWVQGPVVLIGNWEPLIFRRRLNCGLAILVGAAGACDQYRRRHAVDPFAAILRGKSRARFGQGHMVRVPALTLPESAPALSERMVWDDWYRVVDGRYWLPPANARALLAALAVHGAGAVSPVTVRLLREPGCEAPDSPCRVRRRRCPCYIDQRGRVWPDHHRGGTAGAGGRRRRDAGLLNQAGARELPMHKPHSCKSRFCPTCGKHATDVWADRDSDHGPWTMVLAPQ